MSDDGDGDGESPVSTGRVAVLLVLGLPVVVVGAHDVVAQDRQIAGAERTAGTVVAVDRNFAVGGGAPGPSDRPRVESLAREQYGTGRTYVLGVTYRYSVEGRTYTSRTPYPTRVRETLPAALARAPGLRGAGTAITTDDLGTARRYAGRFRENSTVVVRYESGEPGDSFLLDHYSLAPYLVVLAGLIPVVPAVVVGLRPLARRPFDDPGAGDPRVRSVVGAGLLAAPGMHLLVVGGSLLRGGALLGASLVFGGVAALSGHSWLVADR